MAIERDYMKEPVKVGIVVELGHAGELTYSATSKDLVQILGLIELAKSQFIKKLTEEQSRIVKI